MPWLAGEIVTAEKLNTRTSGVRINTLEITTPSSTFTTTEVVLATFTADLVEGRVYQVTAKMPLTSDTANAECRVQLREDTLAGTILDSNCAEMSTATSTTSNNIEVESEYQAVATGTKTFVVTGQLVSTAGPVLTMNASGTRKGYVIANFIRV
jgi:hypothetical protein